MWIKRKKICLSIKCPYSVVTLGRSIPHPKKERKKNKKYIIRKDPEIIQYKNVSVDESMINQSIKSRKREVVSNQELVRNLIMSSSSAAFAPDHHLHHHHLSPPSGEQLCYVQCNFCDTVLAVSYHITSLSSPLYTYFSLLSRYIYICI